MEATLEAPTNRIALMKGIKIENDGKKSLQGIWRNGIRRNGIRLDLIIHSDETVTSSNFANT